MNETNLLLASLSSDLVRIAKAAYQESPSVARRFIQETDRWLTPLESKKIPTYIQKCLNHIKHNNISQPTKDKAEDYLTSAIIIRNYVVSNNRLD